MVSPFTKTYVYKNGQPVNTLSLGGIKNSDIVKMTIWTPLQKDNIQKTGKEIKEKGGNVFFDEIELLGAGKIRRHTIGLIQLGYNWRMEKTISDVQFYKHKTGLFTPFLLGQKELLESMKTALVGATDIPEYGDYHEFSAEANTVKWFDPFRLIGCIAAREGDAFFHWNDVKSGYKHNCLKPGTKVIFSARPTTGAFPLKANYVIK